jgi:hypothetical protein
MQLDWRKFLTPDYWKVLAGPLIFFLIAAIVASFTDSLVSNRLAVAIAIGAVFTLILLFFFSLFFPLLPEKIKSGESGPTFSFVTLALCALVISVMLAIRPSLSEDVAGTVITAFLRRLGTIGALGSTLILFGIGIGLHQLKVRRLETYAIAEIIFALVSCYLAIDKMRISVNMSNVSVAVASVYIVVRGLDNLKNSRAELTSTTAL